MLDVEGYFVISFNKNYEMWFYVQVRFKHGKKIIKIENAE